ncbi:predicted protein [Naegleria gruberi]|uniref:Predicted protein n=1 Tax=Naegleria gruberi TaxID=5762 RepID=D2VFW1_NAEGR|nr:uncharacterized protein NAEGRDRAFT_67763 [Naegleria gruberi]EFC44257.1 predicted protein [Naegleria gruberi]|eukprot:XP_002677001.1 predicted protein [Naegleria gruberi strain NEG-M]
MKKLGLSKDDSFVYMYPKVEDYNIDEKANSCPIACSFAPTFPSNKYDDREEYIKKGRVLTFIESKNKDDIRLSSLMIEFLASNLRMKINQFANVCLDQQYEKTTNDFATKIYKIFTMKITMKKK